VFPFLLIGHRFHEGLGGIRSLATGLSLSEAHLRDTSAVRLAQFQELQLSSPA
jgi:hypothetical protein